MFKKYLFFLAVFVTTHEATAQTPQLRNLSLSDENSRTIYIGMENKFKISNFVGDIKVEAKMLRYNLREDTLILWPISVGSIMVSLTTKHGSDQVIFTSKRLPDIIVSIGGISTKVIPKTVFLNNPKITIDNKDGLFDDFMVDSTVINLNERTFKIKGDYIPDQLLEAIKNTEDGNLLEINYLRLKNATTGRAIVRTGKTTYELK